MNILDIFSNRLNLNRLNSRYFKEELLPSPPPTKTETEEEIRESKKFNWENNLNRLLLKSCQSNDLDVVKYLVEKGADVNFAIYSSYELTNEKTPLHYASETGNLEIVKYLLEKGAAKNKLDIHRKAPFYYASGKSKIEILELLI